MLFQLALAFLLNFVDIDSQPSYPLLSTKAKVGHDRVPRRGQNKTGNTIFKLALSTLFDAWYMPVLFIASFPSFLHHS